MQNESNMPYYFLCDCQSNIKNIFAKFHKNIPNLSQEIEKNTENVPPTLPQEKQNSKSQNNSPYQRATPSPPPPPPPTLFELALERQR